MPGTCSLFYTFQRWIRLHKVLVELILYKNLSTVLNPYTGPRFSFILENNFLYLDYAILERVWHTKQYLLTELAQGKCKVIFASMCCSGSTSGMTSFSLRAYSLFLKLSYYWIHTLRFIQQNIYGQTLTTVSFCRSEQKFNITSAL